MTPQNRLLFLVGMPASGKSTVGYVLAQQLGYAFSDTDALIEEKLQLSVKEIFEKYDESFFRTQEQLLLSDFALLSTPTVIATGGGFPCFSGNMEHLLRLGTVVFLNANRSLLQERLSKKSLSRPLLSDANSLAERLQKLWEARIEVYKRAHFTIEIHENSLPYNLATEIQSKMI